MDRNIVYPGAIPQDTDILNINRNVMVALGALIQMCVGTNTIADGLACTATSPASMTVNVGPGSIIAWEPLDSNAYGSLAADTADSIMKMGINLSTTPFTLSAPTTAGQSVIYLVEAAFLEEDTDPVVLPYYNAANPSQPFSGPNNSGTAQNTMRIQRVQLQVKAGASATTGSETMPSPDPGYIGLWGILVNYGDTSISQSRIFQIPNAPVVPFKLPMLTPGTSRMVAFSSSGQWTVPNFTTSVKVRCWGGGGGGGAGGGTAGAGGAGAGYAEAYLSGLTPGTQVSITVGAGGSPGAQGGSSGFGTYVSATGGAGGGSGSSTNVGVAGVGGTGSGPGANFSGAPSQNGLALASGAYLGGMGGGSFGTASTFTPGGTNANGLPGNGPGGGGSGGVGAGSGGPGAPGLVIVEW
ncbi:MAG: hypothetical protein K6U10_10380 [Acidobacteriia bacterium]|nr:hypothetical protein [Methyloceanibacter sp.]MCL6492213.1 hypothetical protein [Terriglobia bacterium]